MPKPTSGSDTIVYNGCDYLAQYLEWIHPNVITFISFLLIFPILSNYWYTEPGFCSFTSAIMMIALRSFLDCLDGTVARKYYKTSEFGAYLDIYSDIFAIVLILGSVIYLTFNQGYIFYPFALLGFSIMTVYHLVHVLFVNPDKIDFQYILETPIIRFFHDNQFILGILFTVLNKFLL